MVALAETALHWRPLPGWGPPDLSCPRTGVAMWEHDRDGVIYTVPDRLIDDDAADFMIAQDNARLRRGVPLTVLHDWSASEGYTSSARARLTRHVLAHTELYARIGIAVRPASRLLRMGVQVASTTLALAGVSFRVYPRLEVAVRALGLRRG
ncbi:MAG: hypothetical protein AAF447_20330 [Myxococcota bacterium]